MKKILSVLLAMLFLLVGCSMNSPVGDIWFGQGGSTGSWVKDGVTPTELRSDYQECESQVNRIRKTATGIEWGVADPLIGEYAASEIKHKANERVKKCMEEKGYIWQ